MDLSCLPVPPVFCKGQPARPPVPPWPRPSKLPRLQWPWPPPSPLPGSARVCCHLGPLPSGILLSSEWQPSARQGAPPFPRQPRHHLMHPLLGLQGTLLASSALRGDAIEGQQIIVACQHNVDVWNNRFCRARALTAAKYTETCTVA
eukprot:scaffold53827_cov46-Prasinocladus_malaysianus.AAC.6